VVVAEHRSIQDPELEGRYTIKVYSSSKVAAPRALARSGSDIICGEYRRNDLPRMPEAILQPSALFREAAFEERAPVAVDLGLGVAVHDRRDRVVERVERDGAHGGKGLPEKNEVDDLYRAGRAARRFAGHRHDAVDA
jgi:hypothetical protein